MEIIGLSAWAVGLASLRFLPLFVYLSVYLSVSLCRAFLSVYLSVLLLMYVCLYLFYFFWFCLFVYLCWFFWGDVFVSVYMSGFCLSVFLSRLCSYCDVFICLSVVVVFFLYPFISRIME